MRTAGSPLALGRGLGAVGDGPRGLGDPWCASAGGALAFVVSGPWGVVLAPQSDTQARSHGFCGAVVPP